MRLNKILRRAGIVLTGQPERKKASGLAEEIRLPELPEKEEPQMQKRIALPKSFEMPTMAREDVLSSVRAVRDIYPLIATAWKGRKYSLATANIRFNPIMGQLVYEAAEPSISIEQKEIVKKTIDLLHEKLELDFSKLTAKKEVYAYVDDKVDDIWDYLGLSFKDDDIVKMKYYIYRDVIGLGKIEPLMRDSQIEDITCDGVNVPVFIFHRNPFYGEMPTNVWFETKDELDAFVMKLAQKTGKTVSMAEPLLDSALPDGSRLQITYGTDIARKGSNFSIRKFFKTPLTVVDLVGYETADPMVLAYLWLAIEEQQSILVSGTTAVGKTTFLNSIAQFIPPSMKIVSIEDTSELNLVHTNWTPQVARVGFGPKKYGEITMFDLLKAALRQRPDYIVVGEVRGREASVMFQAMATGHSSLSTIHADSVNAVIDRLTTRPIDLSVSLLQNLDIIIFLEKTKRQGRLVRKVGKIVEVEGYNREKQILETNEAFEWIPSKNEFAAKDSFILQKIATKLGWNSQNIKEEMLRRANVIGWMHRKNIHAFRDVARVINMYYVDPKRLAGLMRR